MKKYALGFVALLAFCMSPAFAQTGGNSQGTTESSPTSSGSMQNNDQTGGAAAQSGQMDSAASDNMHKDKGMMKGEKTLKGCVQSQNGSYMLEEHGGKMVNLSSSQDLAAHVGHTVKVHGSYATSDSAATSGSSAKTFNVSSVDAVSDTCAMGGKMGKKDKMGNPGNAATPQ